MKKKERKKEKKYQFTINNQLIKHIKRSKVISRQSQFKFKISLINHTNREIEE